MLSTEDLRGVMGKDDARSVWLGHLIELLDLMRLSNVFRRSKQHGSVSLPSLGRIDHLDGQKVHDWVGLARRLHYILPAEVVEVRGGMFQDSLFQDGSSLLDSDMNMLLLSWEVLSGALGLDLLLLYLTLLLALLSDQLVKHWASLLYPEGYCLPRAVDQRKDNPFLSELPGPISQVVFYLLLMFFE